MATFSSTDANGNKVEINIPDSVLRNIGSEIAGAAKPDPSPSPTKDSKSPRGPSLPSRSTGLFPAFDPLLDILPLGTKMKELVTKLENLANPFNVMVRGLDTVSSRTRISLANIQSTFGGISLASEEASNEIADNLRRSVQNIGEDFIKSVDEMRDKFGEEFVLRLPDGS